MPRALISSLLVAVTLLLACDRQMPTTPTDLPAAAQPEASLSSSATAPHFDPKNFVRGVDNRFFPLPPGTRFIYVGQEDGEPVRNLSDVTRREKTILGVKVTVVLDRVYQSGELKEKTLDWYAQDKKGNVWYLGEDSKEYENGVVVSTAGSWEAGKNGARGGIIMPAHPHVGQLTQQEFAAGVAEDMARVLRRGLSVFGALWPVPRLHQDRGKFTPAGTGGQRGEVLLSEDRLREGSRRAGRHRSSRSVEHSPLAPSRPLRNRSASGGTLRRVGRRRSRWGSGRGRVRRGTRAWSPTCGPPAA